MAFYSGDPRALWHLHRRESPSGGSEMLTDHSCTTQ